MNERIQALNLTTSQPRRIDAVFYWLGVMVFSFILLPSFALDYGLFESTADEFYDAMGWSSVNISWLWFSLPLFLIVRPLQPAGRQHKARHYLDIGYSALCMLVILISSWLTHQGLGYATILLFIALGAVMTTAFSRLEYLGATIL